MYFHDTDTWDSCDMYYLVYMIFLDWSCEFNLWSFVLVILWSCYTTVTHPRRLMFIIFMWQHVCTVLLYMIFRPDYSCYCYYFQFLINAMHIVLMSYLYCYCAFIFSLLLFFSLRVLLLVHFWRTYIIFQYLDHKAGIESWP